MYTAQVFELVTTAIPLVEPARGVPPEEPTAQWKGEFSARQKAAGELRMEVDIKRLSSRERRVLWVHAKV